MANKNENTENATATETAPAKQPRILKPGLLAAPATVKISGVPSLGRFSKLEVPMVLEGQNFILPLSLQNPEHEALQLAFGEYPAWKGATIQVSDGRILKQVNVRPIADAKGRPVQ